MKTRFYSLALSFALCISLTCCEKTPEETPEPEKPGRADDEVTLLVPKASVIKEVLSSSYTRIAEGVVESDFTLTLTSGHKESIYIISAELGRDDIYASTAVSTASIPSGAWPRKTLGNMGASLERSGNKVLAMINADFWDTKTFIPRGPVHCDGFVMKSTFEPHSNKQQGISYVGCTAEDKMVIGYSSAYTSDMNYSYSIPNVSGSGIMLVEKGVKVDNSSWPADNRHPRSAIGYAEDGTVYFFCVDGRNEAVSEGMTYDDMGSIFSALGCSYAVNFDGGGSTQLLVRNPVSGKLEIRNRPADGAERPVVNAWVIMQKSQ